MNSHEIVEEVYAFMNKKFITPEFLQNIERWARFNGDELMIGDDDIRLINKGTWTVTPPEKEDYGGGELDELFNSPIFKKPVVYDVSVMQDNPTCHPNTHFILLAEIKLDHEGNKRYDSKYPPKLKLFTFDRKEGTYEDTMDDVTYPHKATYARMKQDFEAKKSVYSYKSLIRERHSCEYELQLFHDDTNLMSDWAVIARDLEIINFNAMEDEEFDLSTIETVDWSQVKPR